MSLLGRRWKEPFFGSTLAPVLAQKFQQALREDRVALAVALSEHVNEHALGVETQHSPKSEFTGIFVRSSCTKPFCQWWRLSVRMSAGPRIGIELIEAPLNK